VKFISKMTMLLALCLSMSYAFGQTSASMSGVVSDAQGDPLPGAVVAAVHEPTGTQYSTVTRADGRFSIFNMRVGGPYTVTVTMTGFRTQKEDNIFLKLGENKRLDFTLQLDTVEETMVVVSTSNEIINRPELRFHLCFRSQQPLQQHPDRRCGEYGPVRPGRQQHAGRSDGRPTHQHRRHPGIGVGRLSL